MPQTRSRTRIYLAVISRIHAIRARDPAKREEPMLRDPPHAASVIRSVKVDIATEHGDSSKHLLARILPEMTWMTRMPGSILVEHEGDKPDDPAVRRAIDGAAVLPPPLPFPPAAAAPGPAPVGFGLGENVFSGPDYKPSKWTDSGWQPELTAAGAPDDSDYVAAFQITYGGAEHPYYQSIVYAPKILLRVDYLLIAQQAFIPS
jgi:hypothetical protein